MLRAPFPNACPDFHRPACSSSSWGFSPAHRHRGAMPCAHPHHQAPTPPVHEAEPSSVPRLSAFRKPLHHVGRQKDGVCDFRPLISLSLPKHPGRMEGKASRLKRRMLSSLTHPSPSLKWARGMNLPPEAKPRCSAPAAAGIWCHGSPSVPQRHRHRPGQALAAQPGYFS